MMEGERNKPSGRRHEGNQQRDTLVGWGGGDSDHGGDDDDSDGDDHDGHDDSNDGCQDGDDGDSDDGGDGY